MSADVKGSITGTPAPSPANEVQVIKIRSRFAMLALREGGKPAAAALKSAEAFLQGERSRYHGWVQETLQQLDRILDELPGSIPEALQAAYELAMQLRDLGSTFQAPLVTEAADSLCELLYRLHAAGLYNAQAIATHQAVLRLVCAADQGRSVPEGMMEMLTGLKKIVAKFPRPQPPANSRPPTEATARTH